MSKKTTNKKQPIYITELLKRGTATLTAKTREQLAVMVNNIPASVKYGAGAVAKNNELGTFALKIDIIQ